MTSTTSTNTPYPPASPIPRQAFLAHPRIILRPSSNPSLSAPRSAAPSERGHPQGDDEEEDELQDDDDVDGRSTGPTIGSVTESIRPTVIPAPPMSISNSQSGSVHAASPRGGTGAGASASGGGSTGKSRKSSCELCHHRKIKCDQQRPSCFSCTRKGQICRYAEEAEPSSLHKSASGSIHQRAMSVTIVNASDPSIKYTVPVPGGSTPALKVGYGHGNHPEWKVDTATPSKKDSGEIVGSGNGKKRSSERRDRIVAGFDSDSEDEGEGSSRGKGDKGKAKADVDLELEALVGDKQEEIDELEEDEADQSTSVGSQGSKKRDISIDDDLSGELLELASAAPSKKKKPLQQSSLTTTTSQISRRPPSRPVPQRPGGGRSSLPNQSFTPTSVTKTSALTFTTQPNAPLRFDPYSSPLQNLAHSLPSRDMQTILFNTFFSDPLLTEGISLLQPQYMEDFKGLLERKNTRLQAGDATTLASAFLLLAVALRILPEETSKLLLASQGFGNVTNQFPRSLSRIVTCQPASNADTTPLDQRYLDLALLCSQVAEQADPPSVMLVMFKLILYRFSMLGHRRDKTIVAGTWLAQAVKVAQALGMGKEWEGLTQGERELRRRVMWSLYVADRQHSFDTSFPYTIMDAHQGIHLPSPMAEADLYMLRPETRDLPPHATEVAPTSCTALFIHTHLARRITPILDSFATISAANTPHDLVLRFDASLDAFQDALPPYFRLFPLTETRFDTTHLYLAAHRVRLHSTLLAYRAGVHRTHLLTYLMPTSPPGIRQVIMQMCLSSLRVQRSAKMLDAKVAFRLFNPVTVFENAATLAFIMYVGKAIKTAAIVEQRQAAEPLTPEYMGMRAGISEALELLDTVGPNEGAGFARKAVGVLREIILKVEMPIPILSQDVDIKPIIDVALPFTSVPLNGSGGAVSTPAPLSAHPVVEEVLAPHSSTETAGSVPTQRRNSGDSVTSVPVESRGSASPQKRTAMNPYLHKVTTWLDGLRRNGVNMDVMLREAEWQGAWERIVGGM
ncbi:hypothetical protein IAR55_002217 [Kwoniella newhampshirensis]|uniref:Zn(2)-C6 fungal-type domain-containing protein n=1 Tax=Kwoniella newhampshirensis TaxID=1651941 RepID=A0AAW0Z143_9TREE